MDSVTPVVEIVLGTVPLVASLFVHGLGMYLVQRAFEARGIEMYRSGKHPELFFAGMITLMLATHLAEMLLWSATLVAFDAIHVFRNAFYFVAGTYTTLGYGEGMLPASWRLLAPMIAISGFFAFGWTTGILLHLVSQASKARAEGIADRLRNGTSRASRHDAPTD